MSEKLDGMRCVWDGVSKLWTRSGNEIYAPAFFTHALPVGTVLDGELFLGRGQFQECMSIARRHGGNEAHWKRLSLVVFDAPDIRGDFATRLQVVRAVLVGTLLHLPLLAFCLRLFVVDVPTSLRNWRR